MDHIDWLGLFLYAVVIGIGVGLAMAIWSLLRFGVEWLVNVIQDRIDHHDEPDLAHYLVGFKVDGPLDKNRPAVEIDEGRPLTREEMIKDMQDEIREDPDMYAIIWNKLMITEDKVVDVTDVYDRFHPGKENNELETESDDRGDGADSESDDHEDCERDLVDSGEDQRDDGRTEGTKGHQ